MWRLYLTARATGQRPSELVDIPDRWAALQLDNAVIMVGTAIENAAQEQEQVGPDDKPRWQPRYTMAQLLDPEFRLPLPDMSDAPIEALLGTDGMLFDEVR